MNKVNDHKRNSSIVQEARQLLGYMSRRRRNQLGLLLVLMIFAALSEVFSIGTAFPFLGALGNAEKLLNDPSFKGLIELFHIQDKNQLVILLTSIFIGSVVVANALRIITIYARTRLAARVAQDFSCQLYKNMLLQPYTFHSQNNSSNLIETVTGDTRKLSQSIMMPLLTIITNSFVILALIGGFFFISAVIAIALATILGSAYTGIYYWRRSVLLRISSTMVDSSKQQIKVVQESLGGIRDVLINGTQDFFISSYSHCDREFRNAQASSIIIARTPRSLIEALGLTTIGLFAISLGRDGDFTQALSVLGSLALGANRLLPIVQQSFAALAAVQGTRASLQRILGMLQLPVDPMQVWVPRVTLTLEDTLSFENVWFRYSDQSGWVLQDLNLKIPAMTTVAFVGSTGSGKSTTADLILGLLKPQQGKIWVDGKPLEGERLRQWQQSISHVPQAIFLADVTIAENIAFGIPKSQITFDQVRKAAQLAQIHEFIEGLPAGYGTYVGERGVRLSGGQRQRIGIARALYREASVIVFDEATSALDNSTESEVMSAIQNLSHQFTIIMIAHRLSTVEKCDQIFELDKGQVIAQGTYSELLASSPSFQRMNQRAISEQAT